MGQILGRDPSGLPRDIAVGTAGDLQLGTVAQVSAGTITMLQAGTVSVSSGTVSKLQAGTVTMVQAGTISQLQAGTVSMVQAGTLTQLQSGTVSMVQAGTVSMLQSGTIAMSQAGTVSMLNAGTLTMLQAGTAAVRFLDENGSAYGIRQADNGQVRVINKPYLYALIEGDITGHSVFQKRGYCGTVNNTMLDLWPCGTTYVFPGTAKLMQVVSTSAADAPGSTGVGTVDLHYLDVSYAEQSELITLNGTVAVTTLGTILRVNNFHAISAGSGGYAAGNIELQGTAGTPTYARIATGVNSSESAIWTVPAGKTAYITEWQGCAGAAAGNRMAVYRLRATANEQDVTGIFSNKDIAVVQDGAIFVPFTLPVKVPAQADIKISMISDSGTANTICAGHFSGWYE